MKYLNKHLFNHIIQFNRWNNTSYAVFNSIGRIIHIGFLSQIIHGLFTVKSVISWALLGLFSQFEDSDDLDEDILGQLESTGLLKVNKVILIESSIKSYLRSDCKSIDSKNICHKIIIEAFYRPFFICRVS